MKRRLLATLGALVIVSAISVVTAANSVPPTKGGQATQVINANALKPTQCASLNLTAIVRGSGSFEGGNSAELILGSPGADEIRGRDGNDCILGGAGDDNLRGDGGTDVCIGGPGNDLLDGDCETRIQ